MILRRSDSSPFAVRGLTVAYRDEPVLWNVSYEAEPGRMIAVVGPNGAGKTTLLNAALGLVPKLAGEARFWGQPFEAVRSRVAYVPQRESVDWDFPVSAEEVVTMGCTRRLGWLRPVDRKSTAAARLALGEVGLAEFADRPIGQLSGGQQQRVFLARALVQDADLFVMDEPFAGVDVTTEEVIGDLLTRLARSGKTVLCVHHDLDTVARRFDDALLLNRELVAAGPVADVLSRENLERAYGARAEPAAEASALTA